MTASGVNPADDEARRIIREEVDETVFVEASAGTGKTTELVHRIIATLAAGVDVGAIAVVTFTEKAAGELKLRLRAELERARHGPHRARLDAAVVRLEEARIGTIHAFCADLLREHPLAAGVDPSFESIAEEEADELFDAVFEPWLEEALAARLPGIARAMQQRTDDPPVGSLRQAARELARHIDLDAPWSTPEGFSPNEVLAVVDAARRCVEAARNAPEALRDHLSPVHGLVAVAEAHPTGPDGLAAFELEAAAVGLVRHATLFARVPRTGGPRAAPALDALNALERAAIAFAARAGADLAAILREELRSAVAAYDAAKAARGVLDFDDLLHRTRSLLEGSRSARGSLQRRIAKLFVDEFQDTDAVQAAIVLLLTGADEAVADPALVQPARGKLFVVGDPKQSIYRFRRADLGTYLAVRDRLLAHGAKLVQLRRSFRAVPAIQRFVNRSFADALVEDRVALQAGHVPLEAATAVDPVGRPAVVALPVPRPYGFRGVTKSAVQASLPDAVAAFVAWLVGESGHRVRDPETGAEVPIAPRHVCLLFRSFQTRFEGDVTSAYALALAARDVPTVMVGGASLFDREETTSMVTALAAIEWPDDALHVYATLRGPVFAFTDDLLVTWRARYGVPRPLQPPITALPEDLEPVADALELLRRLHHARRFRTPAETILALTSATRAHVSFALRPSGEQALANVAALVDMARQRERQGALSFRSFVEHLLGEQRMRRTPEPPILEESSEGVRFMTVHKAKGLEFPIVVLCDSTRAATPRSAQRIFDPARRLVAFRIGASLPLDVTVGEERELARDRAESVRLAYVAATRARDMLVVPVVGDSPVFPDDGWLAPLQRAIAELASGKPSAAPGCPTFGRDATLRDEGTPQPSHLSLEPGLFDPTGVKLVVWDPHALDLRRPPPRALRGLDLVGEDRVSLEAKRAGKDRLEAFRAARRSAIDAAMAPSEVVVTATSLSHEERVASADAPVSPISVAPVLEAPVVRVEHVERVPGRPRGNRFGELVHHLLATARLDASVVAEAAVRGRALGLSDADVAAAVEAATRALAHPVLRAAARADAVGACRRECPVTRVLDDGRILEGVVDLAYREDGAWVVVDFKTDAVIDDERRVAYGRQVAAYAEAVSVATGEPARGLLLMV